MGRPVPEKVSSAASGSGKRTRGCGPGRVRLQTARPETTATSTPATTNGIHAESQLPIVTSPRRVYDVRPRPPAWGWQVVGYTWTKSIATGAFLAVVVARLFGGEGEAKEISIAMGVVAFLFLLATTALLVADLKQPKRLNNDKLKPSRS